MEYGLKIIQHLYNSKQIGFIAMQKAERLLMYKCMTKRNISERELNAIREGLKEKYKLVEDGNKIVILCKAT